jgi:DNA-binding transcriptional ArsR family regulator
MNQKYVVKLSKSEREQLEKMLASGTERARALTRARILLKSDGSEAGAKWTYAQICEAFDVTQVTVSKVRKAYAEQGLEAAIRRKKPDREYLPRLDGQAEAHLVALACGEPPEGQARWTLRLLQEKMVELEIVESVSHETVRKTLKKMSSSLG